MKTTLKLLPLSLAASIPVSLAAELTGLNVPAGADALSLFSAFVASLVSLLALDDYARSRRLRLDRVAAPVEKAAHPLAA